MSDDDPVTAANVTVAYKAHSDRRIPWLAELAGYSHMEALGRLVTLWSRCTALQTDCPGIKEIRMCLGPIGERVLVDVDLGEVMPDGEIRVRGCNGRTEWFGKQPSRRAKGGRARAANARRDSQGHFLPQTSSNNDFAQQRVSRGPAMLAMLDPATSSNGSMLDQQAPALPAIRNPESGEKSSSSSRARVIPPTTEYVAPRTTARDELRRRLWGQMWNLAAGEYQKAKESGVDPHAINCWSGVPSGKSPEGEALFEIIDLLAPGDTAEVFEHAAGVIRNRVLVAFAEARTVHRHLRFCIPARMWDRKSFSIAKDLSPEQVTRTTEPRNGASRAPSRGTQSSEPPPVKRPTY